jgi:hypothetical protein
LDAFGKLIGKLIIVGQMQTDSHEPQVSPPPRMALISAWLRSAMVRLCKANFFSTLFVFIYLSPFLDLS